MAVLDDRQLREFFDVGFVRVAGAFGPDAAAAMRDSIWCELSRRHGIARDDRATWTIEAPTRLQHLKKRPEFQAIGSSTTLGAIDDLLGSRAWSRPADWGALFVLFPVPGAPRTVPTAVWHVDAPYDTCVEPLRGVRVFGLLGDVRDGGGGTMLIAGSHRVVERFGATQPREVVVKAARARRALMRSHPWLEALRRPAGAAERVERFMHTGADIDGVAVRVVELTGAAGDIVLVHPGVLHARPVNTASTPRFLVSKYLRARHGVPREQHPPH